MLTDEKLLVKIKTPALNYPASCEFEAMVVGREDQVWSWILCDHYVVLFKCANWQF